MNFLRQLILLCVFTSPALYAAGTGRIFVTNERSNDISVINGSTLEVEATIAIGDRPRGIGLSPDGKELYVAVSEENLIAVVDPSSLEGHLRMELAYPRLHCLLCPTKFHDLPTATAHFDGELSQHPDVPEPQLAEVPFSHVWGGTLAITLSRMPYFARLHPTVLSASGYSGHGVALATLAGRLMARAVEGDGTGFDLMASLPATTFPGGTLARTPLLVLAMSWYAMRDRLGL